MVQPVKKLIFKILFLALFTLGALALRVGISGRSCHQKAQAELAAGHIDEGIFWLGRSARWYLPFAPWVSTSLAELDQIGQKAIASHDIDVALAAYQEIRGATLGTRSFYTPYTQQLNAANQQIARLMAEKEAPLRPNDSLQARIDFHTALLAKDEAPKVPFVLIALSGFALWVGAGFFFCFRAVDDNARLLHPQALRSLLAFAIGAALFLIGL